MFLNVRDSEFGDGRRIEYECGNDAERRTKCLCLKANNCDLSRRALAYVLLQHQVQGRSRTNTCHLVPLLFDYVGKALFKVGAIRYSQC